MKNALNGCSLTRLALVVALPLGACTNAEFARESGQHTDAVASSGTHPVGCWYFARNADADALSLPWGVRLTGERLTGFPAIQTRGDVRVAATLTVEGDADHPFGYWLALPGDSLEIGYPAGGGLVVRVGFAGGEEGAAGGARSVLTGEIREAGDAVALDGAHRVTRPVTLSHAQCP